jgi:MPBQ/MSBQ methyltransferase
MPRKVEDHTHSKTNPLMFVVRLLLGTLAGAYFFVIPIYMWIKDKVWPRGLSGF